jgi:hypothetical protein
MLPALDITFYHSFIQFNGDARVVLHMSHGRKLKFTALGGKT